MDNLQTKNDLLSFLNLVRTEITAFEKVLTQQQKQLKGTLEKWSPKDVFSHLVFWGDHFNSRIRNSKSGEKIPQADDYLDQINDGVFIEHYDQSFSDALNDLEKSFLEATNLLQSFSADELCSKDLFGFLNGRTLVENALGTFGWHVTHHISDFFLKNDHSEKAVEIQEKYTRELQNFPSWKTNATYNLACFYAQIDEKEKAIINLKAAFLSKPDLIEWAKEDGDLDGLRNDKDFKALLKIH